MIESLQVMLDNQAELQKIFNEGDPRKFSDKLLMDYIRTNVLALEDELHEFLGETGWKPWASSNHINIISAKTELVDAFHFFMNLMNIIGMNAQELEEGYWEKQQKNRNRQAAGYTGVAEKCPICHRGLDDKGVDCQVYSLQKLGKPHVVVRCYA